MQNKKAFTLVELIVVITILAILGTIAFISFQGYSASARDSKRISDIQNIKKSLELFSVNTGKYPLPDNKQEIKYDDETLRSQGIIGDNVFKNLSNNLQENPLDPLTETEYIYSVTNSQKEYELLTIYESDLISFDNLLLKANASLNYPKLDGNYNKVYVKSQSYYVVSPSIINSEVTNTGLILNNTNIKSQIITGGKNMFEYGIIDSQIRNLTDFNLSVYTGTIIKNSSSSEKIELMKVFQNAYSGTQLSSEFLYKIIIEVEEGDSEQFINNFVLHSFDNSLLVKVNGECGIDNLQNLSNSPNNLCNSGNASSVIDNGVGNTFEWSCLGSGGGDTVNCYANHIPSRYPGCALDDVIVGIYTVARCDAGNGNYYQWGRDKGFLSSDISKQETIIDGNFGLDAGTDTYGFVWNASLPSPYSWANSNISDNWGHVTANDEVMQGPCEEGYHVPTKDEWVDFRTVSGRLSGSQMYNNLGLTYGGYRTYYGGTITTSTPARGYYWSSTPSGLNAYYFYLFSSSDPLSTTPDRNNLPLATGMKVRCFKN